ncbi:MAG: hypothetical protein V1662_02130 [Candidatus Omnitrophota bacterium]
MMKKLILSVVSLAVVAFLAYGLLEVAQHPASEGVRETLKEKALIYIENIRSVIWARRPPISTLELEESIKNVLPNPFGEFTREDWNWFWHVLYGRYTVGSGWPKPQRQLTQIEVEDMLIDSFPQPFGSFNDEQWAIFWQYGLKKRVF